ncbi:MAG: hypothetical protein QM831_20225 [Kofleriaceae bacterium]
MKALALVAALVRVAHADSKVTLVKPGHGARHKVRLALTNNERNTLELELQRQYSRGPTFDKLQAEPSDPALELELDYEITGIDDKGTASVALRYHTGKTTVSNGTCTVLATGYVRDLHSELVNGITTDQVLAAEHVFWVASMLAVPFPDEEIGVGATWTTTDQVDTPMVTSMITSNPSTRLDRTYELVALTKATATVRVTNTYTGDHPGIGSGEIVVDLASAFPSRGTLSATTDDPVDPHVVVRRITSTATLRRSSSR